MNKVILKDQDTGLYVKMVDDFDSGRDWQLVSIDDATGLMLNEADEFITENSHRTFEKDAANCKTNNIVESEEQANDAFFDQLESDLDYYYDQLDAEEEYLAEVRADQRIEEEIALAPLYDGDYSRKRLAWTSRSYDEQILLTGVNCSKSEFIEWFLLTDEGQNFQLVEDQLVAKDPAWWEQNRRSYLGIGLIVTSMTKILDHQLQKKKEAAIAEIDQLAETAKKALGLT